MAQGDPDEEVTRPLSTPRPVPGWYPHSGGLRFWDGSGWTEHRAPASTPPPPAVIPMYAPPPMALVSDARTNPAEIAIAWILTVFSLGYLLPWAIAASRGKSNSWAVGLVNFFLGWTLIGWFVALIMACTAHQVVTVRGY